MPSHEGQRVTDVPTGPPSRWHHVHFSGKLIVCSVIFGFLLVLIGGIVFAIGNDNNEDLRTNNYEDIQKKPPLNIVGPVIMSIGGFTVITGVLMCLFETDICRKRSGDAKPLINQDSGTSCNENRTGNSSRATSPKPKLVLKKHKKKGSKSPSTSPIKVNKSLQTSTEAFLTPSDSFHFQSYDTSFTSSGAMGDYKTPAGSFQDGGMYQTPPVSSQQPDTNQHAFLTPQNSDTFYDSPKEYSAAIETSTYFDMPEDDEPAVKEYSQERVTSENTPKNEVLKNESEFILEPPNTDVLENDSEKVEQISYEKEDTISEGNQSSSENQNMSCETRDDKQSINYEDKDAKVYKYDAAAGFDNNFSGVISASEKAHTLRETDKLLDNTGDIATARSDVTEINSLGHETKLEPESIETINNNKHIDADSNSDNKTDINLNSVEELLELQHDT